MDKSYLLVGAYGAKNIGDEAILAGMIKMIGRDKILTVFSSDPDETRRIHGVPASRRNLLDLLRSKEVIIGGGQLIQERMGAKYGVLAILARSLGKRCSFYGVGVSEIKNPFRRVLLRIAFGLVNRISVRDGVSYANLRAMGVTRSVEVVDDPFFLLGLPIDDRVPLLLEKANIEIGKRPLIGISPSLTPDPSANNSLIEFLTDYCRSFHNAQIVVLPFSRHDKSAVDNDLIITEELRTRLDPDRFTVVSGTYGPLDYYLMIKCLDLLVSCRLHPLLFALRAGTPSIAVETGYNSKIKPFLSKYALPSYSFDQLDKAVKATFEILGPKLGAR